MLRIKPVMSDVLDDLEKLFCSDKTANNCWCMWFILSVKEFHANGSAKNREAMHTLSSEDNYPVGLLAYLDDKPSAWCAVGPRERYARGIKTPTYRDKNDTLANVWFVPCFFVHKDARGKGLTKQLLQAAVQLAKDNDARAIDGFPFVSGKRRSGHAVQTGIESTFSDCGFEVIRRPSDSRVVMRLMLGKSAT